MRDMVSGEVRRIGNPGAGETAGRGAIGWREEWEDTEIMSLD